MCQLGCRYNQSSLYFDQAGGAKHAAGFVRSNSTLAPYTQGHNVDNVDQWAWHRATVQNLKKNADTGGNTDAGGDAYRPTTDAGSDAYRQKNTDTGKHTNSGRKENHKHRTQQLQENSPAPVARDSTIIGALYEE